MALLEGERVTRGVTARDGDERVSQNGYKYIKTPDGPWRLAHHLLAESEILGRDLLPDERVIFIDRDRTNITVENLDVVKVKGKPSVEKRRAILQAKIDDLQAQLDELDESTD